MCAARLDSGSVAASAVARTGLRITSRMLFGALLVTMLLYTAGCGYACISVEKQLTQSALGGGLSGLLFFGVWALGMIILGIFGLLFKPK